MAEKVDVFMPLYVADYLRDTAELSLEEHGAYSRLLLHMWGRKGRLVYDHERLARLVGCDREQWARIWGVIADFFSIDEVEGVITQKRLAREIELAQERKAAAAESGRRGAEARWRLTPVPAAPALEPGPTSGPMATPLPTPLGTPLATPLPTQWRNDGSSPSPSQTDPDLAAPARDPSAPSPPWRSGYRWCERFRKPWGMKYGGRFYGNSSDGKAQRDLEEQVLRDMPEAELRALWERADEHFECYLASTDQRLVEAKHPFVLFTKRFADFRPDIPIASEARAPPRRAGADAKRGWGRPSESFGKGEQKL